MSSRRGKRGSGKCKKKFDEETYTIEFDENNLPCGDNRGRFSSWFGLRCRTLLPYYKKLKDIEDTVYDQLWLETKVWVCYICSDV